MNKDLSKDFYRYVLPSMVSMLLSGFYSMVDGIFVGNAAGSQALAAINLVYPIQACHSLRFRCGRRCPDEQTHGK